MDDTIPDYLKPQIDSLDMRLKEAHEMLSDPSMSDLATDEITKLEEEKNILLASINQDRFEKNDSDDEEAKYDNRNIIVEIRGAAGGEEAKLWGQDLLTMYTKYAQIKGWKVTPVDASSIQIKGKGAYGKLKYESGVHRVQRVPETESSGRVHTSTATVAVLPELEDFDIHIEPNDIQEDFFRAGGHGGQNVNKVSSAVRLTHLASGIVVTCQDERDQSKNRLKAMERLRQKLWEMEEERRLNELSADRRAQVGTGMRNEKIRTYNFLQDRVTDHRIDTNFHNITALMDGKIDDLINKLVEKFTSPTPSDI